MSLTDREKNALAQALAESFKDEALRMVGKDLLESENSETFTDSATIATEGGFQFLANIASLMMLRLVLAGNTTEEAKGIVDKIFKAYLEDTIGMAESALNKTNEAIQALYTSKIRGH